MRRTPTCRPCWGWPNACMPPGWPCGLTSTMGEEVEFLYVGEDGGGMYLRLDVEVLLCAASCLPLRHASRHLNMCVRYLSHSSSPFKRFPSPLSSTHFPATRGVTREWRAPLTCKRLQLLTHQLLSSPLPTSYSRLWDVSHLSRFSAGASRRSLPRGRSWTPLPSRPPS